MLSILFANIWAVSQPDDASQTAARQIELAERRGTELYAFDRVAWVGTDHALPNLQDRLAELRGYVITQANDGLTITFFGEKEGQQFAAWRATYDGEQQVSGGRIDANDPAATLTSLEEQTIAARAIGIERFMSAKDDEGIFWCANNPNVAVLPPAEDDAPFLVYLMTPQTSLNSWPAGGHSRIEVARDGSTSGMRGFSKSCLELGGGGGENEDLSAMYVTHILDPVPTEIHYFTMMAAKVPLIVATGPDDIWQLSFSAETGAETERISIGDKK